MNLTASLLPSVAAPCSGALSAVDALSTTTLPSLGSLLATTPLSSLAPPPCRAKPLVYSPALPPIQAKALEKIRSGVFFDLKELLPDNAALMQRLQEMGAVALLSSPPTASRLREINNPLTWVYCFLSFIAAKTECSATRELVAYAQIVVQLARKHGGLGWLAYDQHFRQQLAGGSGAMWNDINNSLMSATVLAPSSDDPQKRIVCSVCRGDDHSASECALRAIQPSVSCSGKAFELQALQMKPLVFAVVTVTSHHFVILFLLAITIQFRGYVRAWAAARCSINVSWRTSSC